MQNHIFNTYMYVSVCVRERERERDSVCVWLTYSIFMILCQKYRGYLDYCDGRKIANWSTYYQK